MPTAAIVARDASLTAIVSVKTRCSPRSTRAAPARGTPRWRGPGASGGAAVGTRALPGRPPVPGRGAPVPPAPTGGGRTPPPGASAVGPRRGSASPQGGSPARPRARGAPAPGAPARDGRSGASPARRHPRPWAVDARAGRRSCRVRGAGDRGPARSTSAVPGVDQQHPQRLEIGDAAGDDHEAVDERGGGDQRVALRAGVGHVRRTRPWTGSRRSTRPTPISTSMTVMTLMPSSVVRWAPAHARTSCEARRAGAIR